MSIFPSLLTGFQDGLKNKTDVDGKSNGMNRIWHWL